MKTIGTMRAAVITGPGSVEVQETDLVAPAAEQVQVKVEGCGLCGSDLAIWEGRPWFDYPRPTGAPGHEAWGVVERVGDDVTGVQPGDRVAGLFQQAFAEYATTHVDQVLAVPEPARDTHFAGEPLACAANAVRRSGIKEGDTAVVVGIGFIGAAIVAFAKAAGAEVVATSRRPFALQTATAMGADRVVPLDDEAEPRIQEHLDGGLADVVFEVTGRQAPLDLATRLTRIRGTLVIAGYHQDGPRSVDLQLWNWRGLDVVNAHERAPEAYMAGMRHTAALLSDGIVDFSPLYTHTYPLDRLDQAFEAMVTRPEGFMKAVIQP